MKKRNMVAVCAIFLAVLLLFGGCSEALQSLDNAQVRQSTEAMLDALIANDFQAAYALVSGICTEEEFAPTFSQLRELLQDTDSYELSLLYIHTGAGVSNGQKYKNISSVYEMTAESEKLIIEVRIDDQIGLTRFYVTPYEYTDYHYTGTLDKMQGATGVQWLVLLLNVAVMGVALFALVDCCRQKIKKKALWIAVLVLGFVTVGATVSATGFRLNFNIGWITAYCALVRYGSGTVMLRLMLPAGAIAYFAKRRSLLRQDEPAAVPDETAPQEGQDGASSSDLPATEDSQ